MVYRWKEGSRLPVSAQVAGEHLERLQAQQGGRLTPLDVVRDARKRSSPLHPAFEWDDSKAAAIYREERARYILRSLVVVIATREPDKGEADCPVRAFVNVERDSESFYTPTVTALSDEELRRQVLEDALRELHVWEQKYRDLKELVAVFTAAQKLRLEFMPAAD
jgi:hypothetical protein